MVLITVKCVIKANKLLNCKSRISGNLFAGQVIRGVLRFARVFPGFLTLSIPALLLPCALSHAAPIESLSRTLPEHVLNALDNNVPQPIIIHFDDSGLPSNRGLQTRQEKLQKIAQRALQIRQLKTAAFARTRPLNLQISREYQQLPLSVITFRNRAQLESFVALSGVVALYEDKVFYPTLNESLPLISQPQVMNLGADGSGTSVAVLDSGVNYTHPAFGCTAPNTPVGTCKVAAAVDIAPDDGTLDTSSHGTNVSGIIAGVAPQVKLAVLDIFDGVTTTSSLLNAAIDWVLANQVTYNIVAINLSLSDGANYSSPCSNRFSNPLLTALTTARNDGILTAASSGNNGYINGISNPACTPGVLSAGAVYDSDIGSQTFSGCSDSSTAVDKVACFSNSVDYLSLLSPAINITVANTTGSGTSQAAPHVAGAVALLSQQFPELSVSEIENRLTLHGDPVLDSRNNVTTPRLNLLAALGAVNDDFFNRIAVGSAIGTVEVSNWDASKQAGEPDHAGDPGGLSVWFEWTASADGEITLNTLNSDLDTLLAVYTGDQLDALTLIAANDDINTNSIQSEISFLVTAGQQYMIAVDGKYAQSGTVILNWEFTEIPVADPSVAVPALPAWAALILMGILSGISIVAQRFRNRE